MVQAIWTGKYPNHCRGQWHIYVDEYDWSFRIPDHKRSDHMNTHGIYDKWYFTDDLEEAWIAYEDGLPFEDWVQHNGWIYRIPAEPLEIYEALQRQDWRPGQCGGCI